MKQTLILMFLLWINSNIFFPIHAEDSLYVQLNQALANKERYLSIKEQRIQQLKQIQGLKNLSLEQTYDLNESLHNEYKKYKADSSVHYIKENIRIAELMHQTDRITESKIYLANAYSTKGMYIESKDILDSIDQSKLPLKLQAFYYTVYCSFYSHYGQSNGDDLYFKKSEEYRDSVLAILEPESLEYRIELAIRFVYNGNIEKTERQLLTLLSQTSESDSNHALIYYLLGELYKRINKEDLQIKYYTLSAIMDIRNCIKDNASQQSLALVYFKRGDISKAYTLMKSAMEDALFCNVRYRAMEGMSYYPIINASYQEKEERQKEELQFYLILISILSTALIIGILYIYIQVKRLARVKRELKRTNKDLNRLNSDLQDANKNLMEANLIKEEYIAHFFDLCSNYIDKMENYRKALIKKASNNQVEELYAMLRSTASIDNEVDELYKNFDIIFLSLYPSFIEEFNSLLLPEEHIIPKQGELLNTELRIFALIRLGIKDSVKIASFLRYSLRTVYNYRTKVRNKSAVPRDEFESHVEKIGTLRKSQ